MDCAAGPHGRPARSPPASPVTRRTAARHGALECLLTTVLLFGITTIVRWVAGPSPVSAAIPQVHGQLLIIGACVGPLLAGLMHCPAGKASGGHMNPAISMALWRFGLFPGALVAPDIPAQLAGSLLGALAGRAAWGPAAASPPVYDASLQPGHGWSAGELFAAETFSMGVIVFLVGLFLAVHRLAPRVPWLVGFLIGAAIPLLGTTTGGSVNPARQFGPAIVAGRLDFLWAYLRGEPLAVAGRPTGQDAVDRGAVRGRGQPGRRADQLKTVIQVLLKVAAQPGQRPWHDSGSGRCTSERKWGVPGE